MPGCGKSTAAYYLAKTERTAAVMKCSLSSPNRSNLPATNRCAVQLFADLIRKIDLKDSRFLPLIQKIMPLTRYYSKGIECDSELLFNALDKFLELTPKFTMIVDALDEYLSSDNYDRQDFRRLLTYLNEVGSRPTSRVFIFSLPSIDFGDEFGTIPVYLTPAIVESDLLLFVEQEIEKIGHTNPLLMQSKSHIVSCVSTKCQGSFVMAGFVLKNLDGAKNGDDIATILDEFPQQLTAVYQVQLDKIGEGFSGKEKEERRCIFMILVGAFEPFGIEDISSILAFDSKSYSATSGKSTTDTAAKVLRLCWPLLMIKNDQVTYSHSSAKEFLATSVVTKDQSDEFLSRKCLRKLNEPQYKDKEYSARLLRKNLDQSDSVKGHEPRPLASSNFYVYACLHWVEHVTALANPPEDILSELSRFLTGIQYVSSSETLFQLKPKPGIGLQVQFKSALSGWYDKLSAGLRERIPIEEFFVESHEVLSNELLEAGTDKVVPYLPLIRLGQYFNVGGRTASDFQKSYQYKEKVVKGLKEVLGVQHPLTLRAETDFYKEFFFPKRFDEAVQGFREVADLQGSVVGKSSLDYLNTLQLLSLALLSVTKFSEAVETSTEASEGFRNRIGSESTQTLQSEMFRGEALERQAKFEEAYKVQDEALKLWIPIGGERHPLTQGLKTALASASRQLGDYSTAKHALLQALTWRERLFTADNVTYIDTVIQVAAVEYSSGKLKDCLEYLDLISSSNGLKEEFERLCQVIHIRALVDVAEGHYNRAREALQRLVHETGKEQTNRELLWIFITLADVLRRCGEDDEALMLFSGLVTRSKSGGPPPLDAQISHWSLDDEPEPPAQLALAEEALRLVKDAKPEQAKSLLRQNGLKWKRNKDFWILVGGPITNTASISALEPDEPEGWSALSSWSRPVPEETCLLSPRERSHFYAVWGINPSDGQTSGGAKTISTASSTIQAPDQVPAA
jgi:tetratricopeptide (TPR) repeat protein